MFLNDKMSACVHHQSSSLFLFSVSAFPYVTYLLEPQLEPRQLGLLDDEGLVVQVFDDVVVRRRVDFQDDGFYGGVAFYEDAWKGGVSVGVLGWLGGGGYEGEGGRGRGGEYL